MSLQNTHTNCEILKTPLFYTPPALAWWGCCMKPRRSWYTSTWPLVTSPAPMPIVGIFTAAVTAAATVL